MRIQKLFVMLILSILIVSIFGLVPHPIPRAYAGGPQPSQLVTDPSFNNGLSNWTVNPAGTWSVDTGVYHSASKSVFPNVAPGAMKQNLSSFLYVDRLVNISWWNAEGNGWILFDVFYTDGSSDEINCSYTPGGATFNQVVLYQSDLIRQTGEGKCIKAIGFNNPNYFTDYTRVDDVYVYGYVVSYDPTDYQENNDFGNYTYYAESFSNVTFTFWVRVDNFSSYCPIEIGETQDEVAIHPNDKSLKCYLWSNDTGLYFWTMTSDGTLWNQQKNASISLYTWYNVTYSYYTAASTEYGKCWINNALQWTFTTTTDAYNFSSVLCGYWQSIYAGLGTGYPDYISLYFDDIVWKSTDYGGNPAFTLTDDFENGFNLAKGCPNWEVTGGCELSTDYSHSGTHSVHIISPATQIPFIFSNLQITPTSCAQGATLTFSGRLYYQGTMIAPPDGDYNIQVLLSGLNVGSNHTLTSGVWTVTASAPNSAGYYVYTCTATNTSSGVFQTVTVGYTLTISTDSGGSTDPSPGTYLENSGVDVQVTATALGNYSFDHWLLDSVTLNYSNPVTVTMTGNRTVQAFFISNQTDTTPPTFGAVTANTTGAGASVQLSCPVSDNVALNAYWWSWNNTGLMINQTVVSASGGSVNAVLTGSWNASIGNTVTIKIYANDTSNNRAVSSTYNFLLSDPIPPTLENISVNTTIAGSTALFSGLAADNMNVSGFMLQSNLTGSMVNTTWTAFSTFFNSTAAWANITATLPGIVGVTVQWQFYVNDSANNWAASGLVNTTLTSPGSSSLASITFYVGGGGLLYVNGSLTLDETNLNCTIGSTLSLACVPNAGYSFTDVFWTGGLSTTSPASYTVSTDDSIYVYFTSTSTTGSNGGTTTQPTSIQVTITGNVSASPGQTVTFDLLLSWSGGAANLTISSITAGGAYSNWIVVADTLPQTGSGGSMRIALKCTPDWSATVGSDSIPITVTVQPIGGSATTASGSVSVDIVSNQQMGIIPFWSMLILIIFSVIIGSIGYIRRRRS